MKLFENLFKAFKPDMRVKRVKRVYNKDGVLIEETIETNTTMNTDNLDKYFEKMDEVFEKMDEVFKEL